VAGSKEPKLGKIPSAAGADSAARADAAKTADTATSAGNAGTLDGIRLNQLPPQHPPEAFHELGAIGEPAFGANWINGPDTTAGFYKDPFGVVHLRAGETAFRRRRLHLHSLRGYRPATTESFPTVGLIVNNVIPVLVVASRGELDPFSAAGTSAENGARALRRAGRLQRLPAHGSTFRARPG
jgi:hypothetical protein